jgi:hypothetical protein
VCSFYDTGIIDLGHDVFSTSALNIKRYDRVSLHVIVIRVSHQHFLFAKKQRGNRAPEHEVTTNRIVSTQWVEVCYEQEDSFRHLKEWDVFDCLT